MSLLPSETGREDSTESYVPFKNFFALLSFIASVDVAVGISSSLNLACSQSFFGRTDDDSLALAKHGAQFFAWSAAAHGAALFLSLLAQLLFTSPRFGKLLIRSRHKKLLRWLVGSVAWLCLALVATGIGLIGEGMKVIDERVGALLQWTLLACGLPMLVFWIGVRLRVKHNEMHKSESSKNGKNSEKHMV